MSPTRPILRYHGGKWRMSEWIIGHFSAHRVYAEPFGGAASVLLNKPRSHAEIYNDMDGDIVNLFRVLRDPATAEQLRRAVVLTPFARDEFATAYEAAVDPVERARRTMMRGIMGFGTVGTSRRSMTGFRSNANASGTTAAADWTTWPEQVPAFVERLLGVVIENRPAAEVIAQQDSPETLFYVDPPYPHATRTSGRPSCTYRHEMSNDDHRALADALRSVRGMVVLSGYPCDLYDRELYPDWERVHRIALADGARERTEVLWLNPAAAGRRPQPGLFDSLPA